MTSTMNLGEARLIRTQEEKIRKGLNFVQVLNKAEAQY